MIGGQLRTAFRDGANMSGGKAKGTGRATAGPPRKSTAKTKSPAKAVAGTQVVNEALVGADRRDGQQAAAGNASQLIDQRIQELAGWHGATLARMRALILEAAPDTSEEWKWNNPVWSNHGIICTGESYKKVVKLTFVHGASLVDPARLFNSSLTGNTRRAIDIGEGESVDADAFKTLIQAAVSRNAASAPKESPVATTPVKLLSGGNPQIAKADGDAPVQQYIAAMPEWKREVGQRLDALIEQAVPGVRKAVRWNSPFYGLEGQGWFLSFHVLTRYVKVTFSQGLSLHPIPPGGTPRSGEARWIDLYEGDTPDDAQMESWVKQAATLPGWAP